MTRASREYSRKHTWNCEWVISHEGIVGNTPEIVGGQFYPGAELEKVTAYNIQKTSRQFGLG